MDEAEDAEYTRGYYDKRTEKQNYLKARTAGRKKRKEKKNRKEKKKKKNAASRKIPAEV